MRVFIHFQWVILIFRLFMSFYVFFNYYIFKVLLSSLTFIGDSLRTFIMVVPC